MYTVYSDGGSLGNPGVAGYGYVVLKDGVEIKREGYAQEYGTNNQMEVKGCIEGLKQVPDGAEVEVYSDSQYLIRTMLGQFKKGKNLDLWEEIGKEVARVNVVSWNWVKGHADNEYNNICDKLAREKMKDLSIKMKFLQAFEKVSEL